LFQEKFKERELRLQMEQELFLKEQQLSEAMKKHEDLERKLLYINLNEAETKNDNDRLQKVLIEKGFFLKIRISL
jgi:hypothetical protein